MKRKWTLLCLEFGVAYSNHSHTRYLLKLCIFYKERKEIQNLLSICEHT
jgi:hypothetical protein